MKFENKASWILVAVVVLAICAALWTGNAHAAPPLTLTWETPTQYESGLEMPADHIGWYEFEETIDGTYLETHTFQPDANMAVLSVKYRGNHCFTGYTITVDGLKSGPSNVACKEVTAGNPNPPKNVTVE